MGLLDTVASAASGPLAPLLSVGSKILDRVIPDPAAAEAAKKLRAVAEVHHSNEPSGI